MNELLSKLRAKSSSLSSSSHFHPQGYSHKNTQMPPIYENQNGWTPHNPRQQDRNHNLTSFPNQEYGNEGNHHASQQSHMVLPSLPILQQQNTGTFAHQGPQTFIFKKSSRYSDVMSVHQQKVHSNASPLYSIKASTKAKPNITLFQGSVESGNILGTATLHSISSKTDILYLNQTMKMKTSSLSGNHTVDSPHLGKLKWVVSQLGTSSLELRDESSIRLAKYGSASFMGGKQLEFFIPCDDYFVGVVLLSVMACDVLNKIEKKVAIEVLGAV